MFKTAQLLVTLSPCTTRLPTDIGDKHLKAAFWAGKHGFGSAQCFCFVLYTLSSNVYGDNKLIKKNSETENVNEFEGGHSGG